MTKCRAYLDMPNETVFRFGGVGACGQLYKKIDDANYRRLGDTRLLRSKCMKETQIIEEAEDGIGLLDY